MAAISDMKMRLITVSVIGIIGVFTFPALFDWSQVDGARSWRQTIFEFQTLFAGIFAVVAGYITVYQMRISDAKSDKRHEDLLSLNVAAERRSIERALNPTVFEWKQKLVQLANLHEKLQQVERDDRNFALEKFAGFFVLQCDELLTILHSEQFNDGRKYFPGAFANKIENIIRLAKSFRERVSMFRMANDDITNDRAEEILWDLLQLNLCIGSAVDQAESFAKSYSVKITVPEDATVIG